MPSQADLNAARLRAGILDGRDGVDGRDGALAQMASAVDLSPVLAGIASLHARLDALEASGQVLEKIVHVDVPGPERVVTLFRADPEADAEIARLRERVAELESGARRPQTREERLMGIDITGSVLAAAINAERARQLDGRYPPGERLRINAAMDPIVPKLAERVPLTAREQKVVEESQNYNGYSEALLREANSRLIAIQDAVESRDLDALERIEADLHDGWPT